jgi:hypothetical protein
MRNLLALSLLAFSLVGCQNMQKKFRVIRNESLIKATAAKEAAKLPPSLTSEQRVLIEKYERFRVRILLYMGLAPTASWEELRAALIKEARMPSGTSWAEILKSPVVADALTEEKRLRYSKAFGLPPEATWEQIKEAIEKAR